MRESAASAASTTRFSKPGGGQYGNREREKREINRRALSEKLPSCKIHSAFAFETLTARKNASNGGKESEPGKRRDRGAIGGSQKAACFDEKKKQNETS